MKHAHRLSFCLSVCLRVRLSVYLSVWLPINCLSRIIYIKEKEKWRPRMSDEHRKYVYCKSLTFHEDLKYTQETKQLNRIE